MELLQLKYFRSAAAFQNFSKAAERHTVPQSSISKTIASLEQELGCRLFTRSGRHVVLNVAGKAFLKRVELALDSLEDGAAELKEIAGQTCDNIKLAVWEGSKLLPQMLSAFREKNTNARFSLIQHDEDSLLAENFDLCIASLPLWDDRLVHTPLVTEEIQLAVPSRHPLAQQPNISLAELREENFISLASSKSLRRMTDTYCSGYGYLPTIIFESDDAATVRGLIENGLGIAFLPVKTWKTEQSDRIRLLPIRDIDCRRTLSLCWYKTRYLPPAAREFREFTIAWYRRLEGDGPE